MKEFIYNFVEVMLWVGGGAALIFAFGCILGMLIQFGGRDG